MYRVRDKFKSELQMRIGFFHSRQSGRVRWGALGPFMLALNAIVAECATN